MNLRFPQNPSPTEKPPSFSYSSAGDDPKKEKNFDFLLLTGSAFLALIIFAIDLNLPLGIAGGVPYIVVILLGLLSRHRRFIIISAILCSALIVLGFYFSPPGGEGELWKVLTNRFLALFAVWVTVILCFIEKNLKTKLVDAKNAHETRANIILDSTIDGIITIDEQGIMNSFNSAAVNLFGYKLSEVIGQNVKMLMPEPYRSEHDQYLRNYRETGITKIIGIGREVVGLRKDGSTFPVDLGISEMYLGETRMFSGIVRDITERKEIEQALQKSKIRVQSVLDHAIDGIITIDEQGIIDSFNPAAVRLFGYEPSDVKGQNVKMLMPEPYRGEHDQYLRNYRETGITKIIGIGREVVGLRKDGSTFPVDLGISEMYQGETRMFIGTVRDITERKAAEKKLEQTTQKMQLILNSAGEGIYGLDLEGKTTFANPQALKILGYSEEELHGQPQHALIHHTKPDGSPYPREDCPIDAALVDGKVHRESEEVFWRKDGTPLPVEYVSTPIRENGELVGAVVTFKDISQRKRSERIIDSHLKDLKRANELLFTSNKELDDFAYIVSHDLKEPLRGIYNFATFLKEDYEDKLDDEGQEKLDTLVRLSQRMESLINSILYFARLGRGELTIQAVDLNKTLEDVLDNLQTLIKETKVGIQIPEPLPTTDCDATLVREVFQNLLINAIKYNDKPERWVEVGCNSIGDMPNGDGQNTNGSGSSIFYVRDNGIGIHKKYFDSLFRIFKRLNGRKKFGDGTGAGTTIVKKIIEKHQGKIWLESTQGEGTTFYFTLENTDHEQYQTQALDSHRGR